jgi:hypothetical protein
MLIDSNHGIYRDIGETEMPQCGSPPASQGRATVRHETARIHQINALGPQRRAGFVEGLEYCMRKRPLPANAEVAIRGQAQPLLLNGGQTVGVLSATFLADLEGHWP